MPEPNRAENLAMFDRNQGEPVGRQTAFSQALGRLGETLRAVSDVEQRLTRREIGDFLVPNGHHDPTPSRLPPPGVCAQRGTPEPEVSPSLDVKGPQRGE